MSEILDQIKTYLVNYAPNVLMAIVLLIAGLIAISVAMNIFQKAMKRSKLDDTLMNFFTSLFSAGLKVLLIVSLAGFLGIQTTSFVAVIGAAGLAVGLALQGSLSNFAGGVLILIFRPFKTGDFIETLGYSGTVQAIRIFNTILHTPDKKTIILPNGSVSNSPLTNFSTEPIRRVDMVFGIGYDDDLKKAKEIFQKIVEEDERVLQDKPITVAVLELGDNSVNFAVRVFVESANYWKVFFDTHEQVKLRLDEAGISIPYPQRDVHIHQVPPKEKA